MGSAPISVKIDLFPCKNADYRVFTCLYPKLKPIIRLYLSDYVDIIWLIFNDNCEITGI